MNVAVMKTKAETALTEGFDRVQSALPGGPEARRARREAIGRFAAVGLPHRRIEEWKYTDLRGALKDAFPAAVGGAAETATTTIADVIVALGPLARLDLPRIVFVNGIYRGDLTNLDSAKGLSVRPLSSLLDGEAGAGVLNGHDPDADASLVALNAAYATDGAVIDVPAGGAAGRPLLVAHVRTGAEAKFVAARNVIRIGKGAHATIVEAFVQVPGSAVDGQQSTVTTVTVADGACLDHIKVARDAGSVTHLADWSVTLGDGAVYRGFQLTAGVGLARNDIRVLYDGEDAKLDLSGTFLARKSEHIDTTLVVDHAVRGGESRELFKGVLDDAARGVFQGKVIVRPDAQKTDGKQMAQALMLSEDAEFDSKPELEIYADDVACGHGSTSAALDDDLLFYLRARGIPLDQARGLLIQSFVGEAIDKVEDEGIREALAEMAADWLAALVAR
ncbi:MAG: Fe-S cluster assembly protein SufD [Hyphomicrobiaceae bacterium]